LGESGGEKNERVVARKRKGGNRGAFSNDNEGRRFTKRTMVQRRGVETIPREGEGWAVEPSRLITDIEGGGAGLDKGV